MLERIDTTLADAQQAVERLERERDTARKRVDELEAREVDVCVLRGEIADLQAQLAAAQQSQHTTKVYDCGSCAIGNGLQQQVAQLRDLMTVYKDEYKTVLQAKAKEIGEIQADYIQLHTAHTTLRELVRNCHVTARRALEMKNADPARMVLMFEHIKRYCEEAGIQQDGVLRTATLPREGGAQGDEITRMMPALWKCTKTEIPPDHPYEKPCTIEGGH